MKKLTGARFAVCSQHLQWLWYLFRVCLGVYHGVWTVNIFCPIVFPPWNISHYLTRLKSTTMSVAWSPSPSYPFISVITAAKILILMLIRDDICIPQWLLFSRKRNVSGDRHRCTSSIRHRRLLRSSYRSVSYMANSYHKFLLSKLKINVISIKRRYFISNR